MPPVGAVCEDTPSAVDGIGAEERGIEARGGLGWWDNLIGPGKAFDTDRYFVVSTNLLGSCRGSTGPASLNPATGTPYGTDFPVITVGDMVRAERALLHELGIDQLLAVAGGSLGGMQALEWSIAYPRGSSCRHHDGEHCSSRRTGGGLERHRAKRDHVGSRLAGRALLRDRPIANGRRSGIARMVGHVTYLSAESMDEKFGRRLQEGDSLSFTLTEPDFAVESYLRHQAATFAQRFDANSYLYLSRALTYFDPARTCGGGSLASALGAHARPVSCCSRFHPTGSIPRAIRMKSELRWQRSGEEVEHHVIGDELRTRLLPAGRRSPDTLISILPRRDVPTPATPRHVPVHSNEAEHEQTAQTVRRSTMHDPVRPATSPTSTIAPADPSGSIREPFMPANDQTRIPARARFRSSRPPATSSRTPSRPRPTSTCRSTAIRTRGS